MAERTLVDVWSEHRAAEIARHKRMAVPGLSGSLAALKRVKELRTQELRENVRCTAKGWRGSMSR